MRVQLMLVPRVEPLQAVARRRVQVDLLQVRLLLPPLLPFPQRYSSFLARTTSMNSMISVVASGAVQRAATRRLKPDLIIQYLT